MPSYTTSLRLVQPSTGEYPGTWGTQVNTGLTALVDTSVAGTAAITMTTADYTLSTANGATDEARAMVLNLTGTPGAARNVICPAVSKLYVVFNNTTGGFAQTLKTASGSGISVPNGRTAFLRCDGTNVVEAVNYAASLSLAGTANGVMYLNGSNVVTTGSGLVFDGTNLGIGTSSPGAKLETVASGTALYFSGGDSAVARRLQFNATTTTNTGDTQNINALGSTGVLAFSTNSTERMRLDSSGNLGVGTSSPASKLTVAAGDILLDNARSIIFKDSGGVSRQILQYFSDNSTYLDAPNGNTIFRNGASNTEKMRIDLSGNLGLGATPSAIGGGRYLQFLSTSSVGQQANGTANLMNNAYESSGNNFSYIVSAAAARYNVQAGTHAWFTAPSGTAGNAISFTQAMTLAATGQLCLGVTSPNGSARQTVGGLTTSDTGVELFLGKSGATENADVGQGASLQLQNTTNNTACLIQQYSNNLQFFNYTGGVWNERARITSGGDLLVGTTTTAGAGGITLFNNSGPGFSLINNNNAASTGFVFESFRRSSVEIGSITQNGTTAVLYNTTSDRRLKDNIAPAPSASDVIDAIKIVSHDWKAAPDEHVTYGVIAQDLHAVAPQAVLQGDDGDEIEKTWGVDYSKLVPMLIKEIQQLRARVAALEAA